MVSAFFAFWGEIRKNLQIMWSYRLKTLLDTVGFSLMYVAAMFFLGEGQFEPQRLEPALIGFLTSYFILETMSQMDKDIMMRAQTGTLEQMFMGVISPTTLLLAYILSMQVKSVIVVTLMGSALIIIFGIPPSFIQVEGGLLLGITLVGVLGFGFFIAGITVIYKQIGALTNILFNLILFLNGTFLPLEAMPRALRAISQLFPTTQGIIVMRRVLLEDHTLSEVLEDGSLIGLMLHSSLYLLLGIGFFILAQWKARQDGTLGHY